jgi:hypothetical protein
MIFRFLASTSPCCIALLSATHLVSSVPQMMSPDPLTKSWRGLGVLRVRRTQGITGKRWGFIEKGRRVGSVVGSSRGKIGRPV